MNVIFGNAANMEWRQAVMWVIGGLLIFFAVKKENGTKPSAPNGIWGNTGKSAEIRCNNTDL